MTLYNGFSTINRHKKFTVTDFELVKQDLYNHLRIRKGEKLMNPNFGTIIWDMLYEQLTEDVKSAIERDLNEIVASDPRIAAESIIIYGFENGIQVSMEIRYLESNQIELLKFNFDRTNKI